MSTFTQIQVQPSPNLKPNVSWWVKVKVKNQDQDNGSDWNSNEIKEEEKNTSTYSVTPHADRGLNLNTFLLVSHFLFTLLLQIYQQGRNKIKNEVDRRDKKRTSFSPLPFQYL